MTEIENGFHETVVYLQTHGLKLAMRKHLDVPEERLFSYTGPDWLLLLLDACTKEQRVATKLLL